MQLSHHQGNGSGWESILRNSIYIKKKKVNMHKFFIALVDGGESRCNTKPLKNKEGPS